MILDDLFGGGLFIEAVIGPSAGKRAAVTRALRRELPCVEEVFNKVRYFYTSPGKNKARQTVVEFLGVKSDCSIHSFERDYLLHKAQQVHAKVWDYAFTNIPCEYGQHVAPDRCFLDLMGRVQNSALALRHSLSKSKSKTVISIIGRRDNLHSDVERLDYVKQIVPKRSVYLLLRYIGRSGTPMLLVGVE